MESYICSFWVILIEENMRSGILIRTENAGSIASIEDLAEKLIVVQSGSLQEALTAKHVFAYREFRRLVSSQFSSSHVRLYAAS